MQDEREFQFNVGGVTGLICAFIIMLPLMFIATLIRELPNKLDKIFFGVNPMIAYLLILLLLSEDLIKFVRFHVERDMQKKRRLGQKV